MSEGFFSGLFGPPPPEVLAEMERRRASHFMHLEDTKNRIEGLFDELTVEQLRTLRAILDQISSADERAAAAADYYIGWTASVLKFKFAVCSQCGVDHESDVLHSLEKQEQEAFMDDQGTVIKDPDMLLDKFREITPEERSLMNKYHIDDARIEGTNELVGFICTGIEGGPNGGCGTVYQSIEDRMLKAPDVCSGCFVKAGQG